MSPSFSFSAVLERAGDDEARPEEVLERTNVEEMLRAYSERLLALVSQQQGNRPPSA
jgi:hypothetical protein